MAARTARIERVLAAHGRDRKQLERLWRAAGSAHPTRCLPRAHM
ncbi:MAG: hypothetical protein OXT09_33795 [Myxococcales bacterium]|nr:hypothetical protein [Myxococcales bacterium]